MENVVEAILISMSSVNKPQLLFMMNLFSVLVVFQGKATFRNLSRYCEMHEKRFSRWYRRHFDFALFNLRLIDHELEKDVERIAAIDASFMRKSGRYTEGLGWFYHGQLGRAMIGLELSLICAIDLVSNTAYAIDAKQTLDNECETRVDLYARQVTELATSLKDQNITYLAADAYYSKVKFIDAICSSHLNMIG
ncbi:Transposase, partial [hydrothermal vent metagenome]